MVAYLFSFGKQSKHVHLRNLLQKAFVVDVDGGSQVWHLPEAPRRSSAIEKDRASWSDWLDVAHDHFSKPISKTLPYLPKPRTRITQHCVLFCTKIRQALQYWNLPVFKSSFFVTLCFSLFWYLLIKSLIAATGASLWQAFPWVLGARGCDWSRVPRWDRAGRKSLELKQIPVSLRFSPQSSTQTMY